MSRLRKHLEGERARHQAMVYPGNLVEDILGASTAKKAPMMSYADPALRRRSSIFKLLLGLGSVGAVAAALALFVWLHSTSPTKNIVQPIDTTAMNTDDEQDVPLALNTPEEMPDDVPVALSSAGSITPEYESMASMSVPSLSDLSMSSTDTTTNNTTNN
jgi:hypothetical protein